MEITERPASPTTLARQARGRRNYLRSLQGLPVGARGLEPKTITAATTKDRFWLFWVAILSFPSLIFGLLYVFYVPGDLGKFLNVGLTEALVLSGLFGGSTAFAAFIVTIKATLQEGLAKKTKIALWTLVVLSLATWFYIWISFSALVQMPPLIPLKL